jgi:hypothetical protein
VKSNDIINVKTVTNDDQYRFLRSHDFTFSINNKDFQEVVGHTDRIGANDEVLYIKYK